MTGTKPHVLVLGTRGIPAAHGGFETFAERLALFLVARGWRVTVYCQQDVERVTERYTTDLWHGAERVHVQVARKGAAGTIAFDWLSVKHAATLPGVCLVLGYNTAFMLAFLRAKRRSILINMDGIEWLRPKWSFPVRCWFYVNEWLGALLGHRLVADHPAIADHLAARANRHKIVTIPYGGDTVTSAPIAPVAALGLTPNNYLISIARLEPDNNILEIVEAFSRRPRGAKLVVLGRFEPGNRYQAAIRRVASCEVVFPGAIYDKSIVAALRFHARAYCHGHTVGGTNPSLVESLWCGNAILAHRNRFNEWTAGGEQFYFSSIEDCDRAIGRILTDDVAVMRAGKAARMRATVDFDWHDVLAAYERELTSLATKATPQLDPNPAAHIGSVLKRRT